MLSKAVDLGGAHRLTHAVKDKDGWQNLGTYNRYQAEEFGRFVSKLKNTNEPGGEGNMLDNTFCHAWICPELSPFPQLSHYASQEEKPWFFQWPLSELRWLSRGWQLAGAGVTSDAGWRSQVKEEEPPLAKLFVSILQRLGVETDSFA